MVVFSPIRAFFDTDTAAIFSKDFKNICGGPICDQELWVIGMISGTQETPATSLVVYTCANLLGGLCAGLAAKYVMWRQRMPLQRDGWRGFHFFASPTSRRLPVELALTSEAFK